MADIIATTFRFRQFLFEFGPWFLAAWLGLAVVLGLTAVLSRHGSGLGQPGAASLKVGISGRLYYNAVRFLRRRVGEKPDRLPSTGWLVFSLAASVPGLVVTSLISMEALFLRLILTVAYALLLGWFISRVILRQAEGNPGQITGKPDSSPPPMAPAEVSLSSSTAGVGTFARVSWRSFSTQFNEGLFPIIAGFALASALTIYLPAYWLRPLLNEAAWFGPYLAAALAIPFQLGGGAEVPLAAALMVKGASLGVALSVMMVAPITTVPVIQWLRRSAGTARATLYVLAAWLVAGSLGVVVNLSQSLLAGG